MIPIEENPELRVLTSASGCASAVASQFRDLLNVDGTDVSRHFTKVQSPNARPRPDVQNSLCAFILRTHALTAVESQYEQVVDEVW